MKQKDWEHGFERLPSIRFCDRNEQVEIRNVRNFDYLSDGGCDERWETRNYLVSKTSSVDFIVVPFPGRFDLAHTMVSFGFSDGRYLLVSVEARRSVGQPYSIWRGMFRAYPIMYVIADERDAIGIRTELRKNVVQVYRSAAGPAESAQLFVDMLKRAAALGERPEYYNTIFNNCLTNIRYHVNQLWPGRVPWHRALLLTARSDEFAYQLGLLSADQRSFDEIRSVAEINEQVHQHWDHPEFSNLIRERMLAACSICHS